ncbi:MAG: ABC transporter permease [Anaerolineae bacterium]
MNFIESIRIALRSLSANRLRSFLTMLGVIIGVAAVIAMLSIGRGAQAAITAQIQGLGTNLLFVQPGSTSRGGIRTATGSASTLTLEDANALANPVNAPSVALVAPEVTRFGQVVAQGQNANVRVTGVTEEYQWVRNTPLQAGDFIVTRHVQAQSAVAVLGSQLAADLFGEFDPIGQTIYLNRVALRVIGVLASKGGTGFFNPDEGMFVPITTAQRRLLGGQFFRGGRTVSSINVQVADETLMDAAVEELSEVLRQRHRVTYEDDFRIMSQQDFLSAVTQVTGIMTLFLAGIAAISLVVGGIGIMNIMLVSVTERTREIGIRKAVGARRRDILAQFLVEAVVLSVAGGALGILVGAGIGRLISGVNLGSTALTPLVELDAVLLAVLFSAGVGLFFGVYPAWRAAQLHPIEALRYE